MTQHRTLDTSPPATDASHDQLDEQFRALMEGLRTTLPGVQVLFAFLLTLPFYGAFNELSDRQRVVYYVAFLSGALATVLLVAPSVHQRLRAKYSSLARRHPRHVMTAVRLANAGTALAALALVAAAYLVTVLVFDDVIGALAALLVGGLAAVTWAYLPLVHWKDD